MIEEVEFAVVGAGPAGAMFAAEMADAGAEVRLIDEKPAWEKPCGGGVTDKALRRFTFLAEESCERNFLSECELISRAGRCVRFSLDRPVAVFSRQRLNGLLLERAKAAGAAWTQNRVVRAQPEAGGWRVQLRGGSTIGAKNLVLAAGARNPFARQFGLELRPEECMATAGYYLAAERLPWPAERMIIAFLPGIEGYIWSFGRTDHASVGICGKLMDGTTAALRRRLEGFLVAADVDLNGAAFYSHLLPAPADERFRNSIFQGECNGSRWAAIGDAAGMVDPITGEGLYYALTSAELLARAWKEHQPELYPVLLRREVLPELQAAARASRHFYRGRFLGDEVVERLAQFTQHSARFRRLMCDLFSGSQEYRGLRARLYRNLFPVLFQTACSGVLRD